MGFFKSISKSSSGIDDHEFWNPMESEEDLLKAIENSNLHRVIIFKHSTRCPISKIVMKSFENQINNADEDYEYWYLDLLRHRELSNKIAEDFEVTHQSPQIIVLEKEKAIFDASHQAIDLDEVKQL